MTPQAFAEKWRKSTLKESASYQEHFGDICRMLGHQTPIEADPTVPMIRTCTPPRSISIVPGLPVGAAAPRSATGTSAGMPSGTAA